MQGCFRSQGLPLSATKFSIFFSFSHFTRLICYTLSIIFWAQNALAGEVGTTSSASSQISIYIPHKLSMNLNVPAGGQPEMRMASNFPASYRLEIRNLNNETISQRIVSSPEAMRKENLPGQGIAIITPE